MSETFKDPLDNLIKKYEKVSNEEKSSDLGTVSENIENPDIPKMPEEIILPTDDSDNKPASIDIDYGDNDLEEEIKAEEAEEAAIRQEMINKAAARAEEKKTLMPPDSHDPNVLADFANYQTEKVAIVTTMVNKVIAKYHITEGGIPELPDITTGIKGRREVMGDLIEYYDINGDVITSDFEKIILNNWVMNSGERAATWICNPHASGNAEPADGKPVPEKPPVQVNEKLETVPQITINVPEGSEVTVNVDSDVVRNMSESRKIDITVKKVSAKEMLKEVILNSNQKGLLETYDTGVNDTPITLPASAYRCVVRPINYFDFIRLVAPTSQNRSDDEMKKWSVIYKHIKNVSIGAFKDFDDFLKKTKYQDRELLMWAVLVATADEEETLTIKCSNEKCNHKTTIKYHPRNILHLDTDLAPKHYIAAHEASTLDEACALFDEVSNNRTKYTLPSERFKVEISEPSAYEFITKKIPLIQKLYNRYVPDGDLKDFDPENEALFEYDYISAHALYISSMSIIKDDKEYMFDGWDDIENIMDHLDPTDSAALFKLISEARTHTSPISFYLEDQVCPMCGQHSGKQYINDIGQTLLFQVSRRLNNMEINLNEMD